MGQSYGKVKGAIQRKYALPGEADILIPLSPQESTDTCGGQSIAYAMAKTWALLSQNMKDLWGAMGNPPSLTTKSYWQAYSDGKMLPDDLQHLGSDIYAATAPFRAADGLSAGEMFRYVSAMFAFGVIPSGTAFELKLWGAPAVGQSQDDFHWCLKINGGFADPEPPDGQTNARVGPGDPSFQTAGVYCAATIGVNTAVTFKKEAGGYPGPGPQGVVLTNPASAVTHDPAGYSSADKAAVAVLTS
jgi:hypothetical protein